MTVDEKIDKLLDFYKDQEEHVFAKVCENILNEGEYGPNHNLIYYEMTETKNLIRRAPDNPKVTHRITANGVRIIERGGWLKNLQIIANEKATIETKETKRWTITTGITVLSMILAGYAVYLSRSIDIKESELTRRLNKIDSNLIKMDDRVHLVETRDKEIEKMKQKIDSLSQPPKPFVRSPQ